MASEHGTLISSTCQHKPPPPLKEYKICDYTRNTTINSKQTLSDSPEVLEKKSHQH
uniref:Uncharacterized protein n=1 Tax=Arion vulgaris TaxID=1028688 RepID=A0A0B7C0A7_9EUPU